MNRSLAALALLSFSLVASAPASTQTIGTGGPDMTRPSGPRIWERLAADLSMPGIVKRIALS
jgi:hypothetical protein